MIQVFFSHSAQDAALAELVIDLLKTSLNFRADEIRCTSVEGYRLPAGADTAEQLRDELVVAPAFIGLISPQSFASAFVLFELGARWGAKKHLLPLLAPGVDPSILRGPISNLNALRCDNMAQIHQLVHDLATHLGREADPPAVYQSKVDAIMACRAEANPSSSGSSETLSASLAADDRSYSDAEAIIQRHCESEWPSDFEMRAYCVKQQREAVEDLKRGGPADISAEVFADIRRKCSSEWPEDYTMRYYCERGQIDGYRRLYVNP